MRGVLALLPLLLLFSSKVIQELEAFTSGPLTKSLSTRGEVLFASTELQEQQRDSEEVMLQKALTRTPGGGPKWIQARTEPFPFQCTECGKCCQTIGYVYMSPEEVGQAAGLLQLEQNEFIQRYASHTLGDSNPHNSKSHASTPWIRLKDNKENGCIFLDETNRQCTIYAARPVQCRTYPFWPQIMAHPKLWNEECRRRDDDLHSQLPPWDPENGGCEGMGRIPDTENSYVSFNQPDESIIKPLGVSVEHALDQWHEYVTEERRFPHRAPEIPL